jgi:putative peptide zinc metalloprotease protein
VFLLNITLQSRLSITPIEIRKDKKHYIVEDKLTGDFYEMPEVCIDAIDLINQGFSLGEIETSLIEKFPNEEVNLVDFANQLFELGLIDQLDGEKIEKKHISKEPSGMLWVSPKLGRFFFNKFTVLLYSVILVLNIVIFIVHPSLFPHRDDIFVFDIMFVNVIFWMAFSFLFVLIHEFGHVLAIRAHNLPTKMEIGHRMFFVVLLTDMSSIWRLPPKDRNILFLAGLYFDSILLFLALITQLFFPNSSNFIIGLVHLATFDIVLRMIFQCCIYMKTDLYYVFENISGCYNLMENAKQAISKRLSFLKLQQMDEVIFSGEKRTVSFYTLLYFLGFVITIFLYFHYYIPEIIHVGEQILPGFINSPTSLLFWDAVVFSLQVGIFILLLLNSWRKKYIKN